MEMKCQNQNYGPESPTGLEWLQVAKNPREENGNWKPNPGNETNFNNAPTERNLNAAETLSGEAIEQGVNSAKSVKQQLEEAPQQNNTMEAITL